MPSTRLPSSSANSGRTPSRWGPPPSLWRPFSLPPNGFLWEVHDLDDLGGLVRRAAGVVDDVADRAHAAQRDGDQVVEANSRRCGNFERATGHNGRIDVEEAVAADAPRFVAGHRVGHLVGGPTL